MFSISSFRVIPSPPISCVRALALQPMAQSATKHLLHLSPLWKQEINNQRSEICSRKHQVVKWSLFIWSQYIERISLQNSRYNRIPFKNCIRMKALERNIPNSNNDFFFFGVRESRCIGDFYFISLAYLYFLIYQQGTQGVCLNWKIKNKIKGFFFLKRKNEMNTLEPL